MSPQGAHETTPLLQAKAGASGRTDDNGQAEDLLNPQGLSSRTRWTVLCAVWLGVFLGALDTTIVSTLVSDVSSSFEKSNQSSWLANLWFGAGAGLGGPLGGLIADSPLGWRGAFLIQIPLLLVSIVLIFTFVRYQVPGQGKSKREMIRRIDYGGSLSLILSLGSLLFALSYKNNDSLPWGDARVWGPLITFGVFAVVFVLVEGLWAPEPVLPLRILKQRNAIFSSLASLNNFNQLFAILGQLQRAVLFPNVLRGREAATSICGGNASLAEFDSALHRIIIRRLPFLPVLSLGAISFLNVNSGWALQWIAIMPCGFGFSSVVTSVLIALIAGVQRSDMATATGISYLFRYIGQVVGVALSSSLLQSVLTYQLGMRIKGENAAEVIEQIRHISTSIAKLSPDLREAAITSYTIALRAVFISNAVVALACFLFTLPIVQFPLHGSFEEEEEARRAAEEAGRAEA
ncbi:hypothetical protein P7C70_g7098, partial [Phenoliferia sp. Uapishka_3]